MQPVPSCLSRGLCRRAFTVSAAIVVSSLIAACGGGGSDGSGGGDGLFMRATINGQVVEYRQFAVAALYPYQGMPDGLLAAGAVSGNQTFPSMAFQLIDPRGIAAKPYLEGELGPAFRYSPKSDEHYVSGLGATRDFKVTITSMSGGIMRGTFSGTVKDEASEGRTVSWAVTNGAFALEIRHP
ncbi:MAG: hypothetical protein R3E42_12245 [Burkholderiaceae bacterium]